MENTSIEHRSTQQTGLGGCILVSQNYSQRDVEKTVKISLSKSNYLNRCSLLAKTQLIKRCSLRHSFVTKQTSHVNKAIRITEN